MFMWYFGVRCRFCRVGVLNLFLDNGGLWSFIIVWIKVYLFVWIGWWRREPRSFAFAGC